MNFNFVIFLLDFLIEIKNVIENGVGFFCFIINMGEDGIYFSVIDYKYINGKIFLILFELVNFNSMGLVMLVIRVKMVIECY